MQKNKFTGYLIAHLRGQKFFFEPSSLFSRMTQNYEKTKMALRLFYAFSLFSSVGSYSWRLEYLSDSHFIEPLWVFGSASTEFIMILIKPVLFLWIFGSLLSFLNPDKFLFRLLQVLGLLFTVALKNSDGQMGHNMHGFLWISLIFLLLPIGSSKKNYCQRIYRYKYMQIFWFSQFVICTFYLMSGYWKVFEIARCVFDSDLICQLDQYILTNIAAQAAMDTNKFAPFRLFFFEYPWIGFWSYMAALWFEIISIHSVFRLHLHRVFGFFRLVFHVGTFLFFDVGFGKMAFPVAILFIFSPFCGYLSPKETFFEVLKLPPFSWMIKIILIKKRKTYYSETFISN